MSFWKKTREIQYELIISLSIIVYTDSFSWFTLSKHNTFTTYAWDLGILDQGFWTTINLDKLFYYTCELHLSESGSFFGIHFSPNISNGAAGWEIANLFADDDLREWWRKYLYLTKDFDSDTDQLKPFDQDELNAVVIPDDWHSSDEMQKFKDELVANLLENNNNAPYDNPQPLIKFSGSTFGWSPSRVLPFAF